MSAQIEAMCRLLEGSGDMTPMATRQILAVTATPANRPTTDHGAAGFCTDHTRAPDERAETVARLWVEHFPGSARPWSPGFERLFGAFTAAVVATLDDNPDAAELARRYPTVLANLNDARAALDRVRALCGEAEAVAADHLTPRNVDHRPCETFARARFAARVFAALDPEEPR